MVRVKFYAADICAKFGDLNTVGIQCLRSRLKSELGLGLMNPSNCCNFPHSCSSRKMYDHLCLEQNSNYYSCDILVWQDSDSWLKSLGFAR